MENINISCGAVELTIDNDPARVIRFYPTDVAFAEGFFSLASEFQRKQKEIQQKINDIRASDKTEFEKSLEAVQLEREAFNVMRQGIDNTFGAGTSDTVFGQRNTIDMVARFFNGVIPYVRKARQAEIERYTKQSDGGGVMEWD